MSNLEEAISDVFHASEVRQELDFIKKYAATDKAVYLIEMEDESRRTIIVLLYNYGRGHMDIWVSYGRYDDKRFPTKMVSAIPSGSIIKIYNLKQIRKKMKEFLSCPGFGAEEGCVGTIEQGEKYYFGNLYRKLDAEAAIDRGWFDAGEFRVYFSIFDDADITAHKTVIPTKIVKFEENWYWGIRR